MPSILSFIGQITQTTTNSFSTIQPDAGTSPVATSPTDTLTLTSSDGSVTITGNSATDTINFQATTTPLTAQYVVMASDATLPNERILTGTANQVIITDNGAGSTVVLSLPQSIGTGSSPAFTGLTLSGLGLGVVHSSSGGVLSSSLIVNADVSASAAIVYSKLNLALSIVNADIAVGAAIARSKLASGTANHVVINDSGGAFSSEATLAVSRGGTNIGSYTAGDIIYASAATVFTQVPIGTSGTILRSTGSAPAWATLSTAGIAANTEAYVTIGNTAGLTAERALTGTANQVIITDNGANSTVVLSLPQSIATGSSPTFTGLTLSGLTAGSVIFSGTAGVLSQDNANFFFTDADDALGLGPSASTDSYTISGAAVKHRMSVHANKAGTDLADLVIWDGSTTAAQGPRLDFARNKNTIASPTAVASGDELGMINGIGYDGTDYEIAASIGFEVDGTPGSNDLPGRIVFKTTPDGSATPAEALRIDSTKFATFQDGGAFSGQVSVGTTSAATAQQDIIIGSSSRIGLIVKAAASQSVSILSTEDSSGNPLFEIDSVGNVKLQNTDQTFNPSLMAIAMTKTYTMSSNASVFQAFSGSFTISYSTSQIAGFANIFLFDLNATIKNASSMTGNIADHHIFSDRSITQGDTNATTLTGERVSFYSVPTFNRINSGTLTITNFTQTLLSYSIGTGTTVTDRRGIWIKSPAVSGTLTTNTAIEIDDMVGTNKIAIRQKGTNAHNRFQSDTSFAQDAAPGAAVDVAGKLFITNNGLITKYNNITTVSNGVPSELATVDLTTQAAAIAATTIYTPAATGLFRISVYLQVTRAATTSSVLGGATGVVITYNDGDGNVAQSDTVALATTAGAIAINAAGNTTTTNLTGSLVVYARTGVAIQYAIGYTSVGVTSMQFAAHLKVEAM